MTAITIGLVTGDPAGVGPELCAKLIAAKRDQAGLRIAVFGGARSLHQGMRIAGLQTEVPRVARAGEMDDDATIALIDSGDEGNVAPGVASAAGGAASLAALEAAAGAASRREIDAIVYGPLNKQAMWLAGHKAIDELHFFTERLAVTNFCCELNNQGQLWTARVTSHIPLRAVAENITVKSIMSATELGAAAAQAALGKRPRIAIAGLNPHLGEGGAMGTEERDVITPAIETLRTRGFDISGLYPADTVFLQVGREGLDLIITMFHDQGQIALKSLGFSNTCTVLGGLPLPVVTASQGTAYDIVGQNRADPTGLASAFDLAHRLAVAKKKLSV